MYISDCVCTYVTYVCNVGTNPNPYQHEQSIERRVTRSRLGKYRQCLLTLSTTPTNDNRRLCPQNRLYIFTKLTESQCLYRSLIVIDAAA